MKRPAVAALLALGLGAGCTPRRHEAAPALRPAEAGSLSADPLADARRALTERAAARERRFREAYEPGSLWSSLRIEQEGIDGGRLSGADLVGVGRELFAVDFGPRQGLGNGLAAQKSRLAGPSAAPNLRHVHYKEFGGPDGTRCLSCHHVGGDGGGGFQSDNAFLDGDGQTPSSGLERNPRSLAGAGVIQQLAEEMTAELREKLRQVRAFGSTSPVPLTAKGVSFGTLKVSAAGKLDPSGLQGVDADLLVRPFGWKGDTATVREMVERALQQNLGVQPERWIRDEQIRADSSRVGDGAIFQDPDADGVVREATDGMVTALVAYIAALPLPMEQMPEDASFLLRASRGAELLQKIGCASCHVPELPLDGTEVRIGPHPGSTRFDVRPLLPSAGPGARPRAVRLYSDLKRHDMGDALAEARDHHGVSRRHWMTPPLWGAGASAPYLHDGRASNINAAILAHDGEGRQAREAYQALDLEGQGAINLFLIALERLRRMEFRR